MRDAFLEHEFPNLATSSYSIQSPATPRYNCIAWAAGDDRHWWQPPSFWNLGGYYWPQGASTAPTIASYVEAFATRGYVPCESSDLEPGFEKIALYIGADQSPLHAARQLPNGRWSSKLGKAQDIEHDTLDALAGTMYGEPTLFFRKQLHYGDEPAGNERTPEPT